MYKISPSNGKRNTLIGLGIGLLVVASITFVAFKASAKDKIPTTPPSPKPDDESGTHNTNGSKAPTSTGGLTPPPAPNATCCKVSYTIDGVTVTGILCTKTPTTNPPKGSLRCHSDQTLYGVPPLRCVTYS